MVELIERTVSVVGVERRVLSQPSWKKEELITYGILLKEGTVFRSNDLLDKHNARQQLYNTRTSLKRFCKSSSLSLQDSVGKEFDTDFETSVERMTGEINTESSRKKFRTEMRRWQEFYHQLLKKQALPEEFDLAIDHLINKSGLPTILLSKLVGVSDRTLSNWQLGLCTPMPASTAYVSKLESLFKLSAGTLVGKLSPRRSGRRFRKLQLPTFMSRTTRRGVRISRYLPDDFHQMPFARQQEIFEAINNGAYDYQDSHTKRLAELRSLRYSLKEWPVPVEQEFEDLVAFKTAERPPIGMRRDGQWRPATTTIMRRSLASLFGALCLPTAAEDVRLRGLGLERESLSIALIACPLLIDWYVRYLCEARGIYTTYALMGLRRFKPLLRPELGWLRQKPHLAKRLQPISDGSVELVSEEMIAKALSDWGGTCNDAITYYRQIINDITPIAVLGRDPFGRIEGVVSMEDPMKMFSHLIREMQSDMPNLHTQPTYHHIRVRDCALILLIALTGLRRSTVSQLNYTGDSAGHLRLQDGNFVLTIPRSFFKAEKSPYFGMRSGSNGYYMELPNVMGLNSILAEYLDVSRPYLISKYRSCHSEYPLFINTVHSQNVRMSPERISGIYFDMTGRYIAENKLRGTGIPGVWPQSPHTARHIRATAVIKKTGSFQIAADANHQSEETARKHYARLLPEDRNERVNEVLFGDENE